VSCVGLSGRRHSDLSSRRFELRRSVPLLYCIRLSMDVVGDEYGG
jgi:hypothetical protein